MTTTHKLVISLAAAACLIGLGAWRRQHTKCEQRRATFEARLEQIRRDADKELVTGTSKERAVAFFNANGLGFYFDASRKEGSGRVDLKTCSPGWYCGDSAAIGVWTQFDESAHVKSHKVEAMLTDCL